MLRLLSFNERPHTFRSLVCTSLTSFCSDTLLAGYRSSVRYLLVFFRPTSRRWRSQPFGVSSPCSVFCIEVMRIMPVNLLPSISFQFWFLNNFLRLLPRCGKESSLFIPSLSLFFGRVPAVFLPSPDGAIR